MMTTSSGSIPWIEVAGQRRYFYTGTSTGDYCADDIGGEPAEPWDEYTDEDGCYMGYDGRYCSGGQGDCPNSVTAPNGERYCRMPPDQEDCNEAGGSSGSAYCGQDDPNYQEPGTGDGGGGDPGDGDPGDGGDDGGGDGDGDGDGGDSGGGGGGGSGGDGNEPGDGELVGGECSQETRKGPDCSEDMDAVECAFGLQLWQSRCDDKLRHEDMTGTDEYRDGDSVTDAENPANVVGTEERDATFLVDQLDENLFSMNASCPGPVSFQLFGSSFEISYEFPCDIATRVRPFVLAIGYLLSGLIVFGRLKGD